MSEPAAAPLAMASEAPPVVVSPPTRSYSLRRRTGESASASDALPAATPAMPPVHPLQQPPSEQSAAAIGSTAEATPSVAPLQYAPATDAQQSHPPLEHATTITLSSVAENGGSEAFISFPLMSSEQPHSALPRPPLDKEQTLHMHSLSRQETPLVHHATRSSPVADKGAAVPHAASSDADALLQELSSLHDSEPSDYVKTLSSDLNAAEASALFLALPSSNSNFKAFDAAELKSMSAVFSVLRIAAGERIITKGEEASFCGIVLSGSLNAVVSATLTVPLGAGEMVGEMALFEGGSRSADIVVGPSSECILAVITFAELDSMASPGAGENLVALQRKLLKMFACASIKKLRKTAQGSSTPSLLAPGDASSAAASRPNSAARPVDGTTTHDKPLANRKSSVATPQAGATAVREGLYRARMALEQSKEAVNKAAAAEKAAQMQQEQYNLTARVSRYKLLSERLKTGLQAQVNQNQALTQQLEETRAELERTSASLQVSFAEHDKIFAKYSTAQSAREAAEKALLNQRGSLQAERDRELASVRAELGEVLSRRVDLELEIDRTRTESATKIAAITERAVAVEATVADAQAKQQAAQQQMEHAVTAQAKAEETAKRILNDNSMLQMQLTLAQVQLKEEIERNHTAQPWKARAADLQLLLESQKKHMMATISQLVAKAATLQHDLARFRQILLYVTASAFVKLYQVKKSARSLHLQISEMLVSVLEAHLLATGATAAAEGASGEGAGSAGIGGETGLQLLRKNLARKKRHYLDHIFRQSDGSGGSGSGSILTLIASLEDEVYKLRRPFEEVQERVGHWRRTSEAFCSRTVELTAEVVKLREQHVAHEQQQAHMQELMQRHNAEYSALLTATRI
jgi:CRP-like cAMP-binding protein